MSKILFTISPSLNAFADKRKGTSGNKIDCAFQHYKNSTISNVQIGALAGVTALAGRSVLKHQGSKAAKAAMEAAKAAGVEYVPEAVKKSGMVKNLINNIKAAPKWLKVATGALAALSLLVRTYKKGTIEQKYLDRAQFVDNTFKPNNDASASTALKKEAAKAKA